MTDLTVGGRSDPPMWATKDLQKRLVDLTETLVQAQGKTGKELIDLLNKQNLSPEEKAKLEAAEQTAADGKKRNKLIEKWKNSLKTTLQGVIQQSIIGGASFETKIKRMVTNTVEDWADKVSKLPLPISTALGALALAFTALTKTVHQALAGLNELYDTGVKGLNGDFIQLLRISGDYQIGLIELIDVLKNHSESITRMTTDMGATGATAFGQLSFAVREQIADMNYFGLTIAETNEMLGDYLDTQIVAGQLQKINVQREKMVVANYIEQITRLAFFTGKRRKQVQAEVEEAARKTSMSMALAGMTQEAREGFKDLLGIATQYGPGMVAQVEDLILTGSMGLTELSAMTTVLMPKSARALKQAEVDIRTSGKLSHKGMMGLVDTFNKEGIALTKENSKTLALVAEHGEGYAASVDVINKAREQTAKAYDADLKTRGSLSELYFKWDHIQQRFMSTFTRVATTFLEFMEKSGHMKTLFGNLEKALTSFTEYLTENWTEEKMNNLFTGDGPNPFSSMIAAITEMFDTLFGKMFDSWNYAVDSWLGEKTMTPFGPVLGTDKSKEEYLKQEHPGDYEPSMLLSRRKLKEWENKIYRDKYQRNKNGGIANVPGVSFDHAYDTSEVNKQQINKNDGSEWMTWLANNSQERKTHEENVLKATEGNKEVSEFTATEAQKQTELLRQISRDIKNNSDIF